MTYEVLERVSKEDLIRWMRRHVTLPANLSDEEFLRQVKLERLLAEEEALLAQDQDINIQLEAAKDRPREFMRLMIESEKLGESLNEIHSKIARCLPKTNRR